MQVQRKKKNDIPFWFLFRVLDLLYGFCLRPEWMDGEPVSSVDWGVRTGWVMSGDLGCGKRSKHSLVVRWAFIHKVILLSESEMAKGWEARDFFQTITLE